MAEQARSARQQRVKRLELDEALIGLFIGAMNANDHVAREELARAHPSDLVHEALTAELRRDRRPPHRWDEEAD